MYGTMFQAPTHPPTERDRCGKLSSTSFALNIDVILGALATVLKTRGCSRENQLSQGKPNPTETDLPTSHGGGKANPYLVDIHC